MSINIMHEIVYACRFPSSVEAVQDVVAAIRNR